MLRAAMLIVQKFGGTSVADIDRIQAVAKRVLSTYRAGHDVAVVVSAMAGDTNRLLGLAGALWDDVRDREVDLIVSTGEQVTAGLMALAIRDLGGNARSFLGHQVKILTDNSFSRARIRSIASEPLAECLDRGKIAVIAGFQGIDEEGNITTLGRGGSDTTAVAIAAALKADVCEIYTDVDGVFTSDPNVVPTARKIDRISYEEMLELSSLGAKVLQLRSVEFGMKYNVPIHVRSSFKEVEGTWVVGEESSMEQVVVSGVTVVRDEAKITVRAVPDVAGVAWRLFRPLSDAHIVVDMIIQNMSVDGRTDMTFTVPRGERKRAIDLLRAECSDLTDGGKGITFDDTIAKISVVGVGMRSHAGVAEKMFELLGRERINIQMISTSEIKISCVIDEKYAELAMRTLHDGFGLHLPPSERASL
jgi:aspartate kinase